MASEEKNNPGTKGTLYLCATPIGNLEDMTYRSVRLLSEVSLIAAEDTRHTRKLLSHYGIHTPLTSYHEHNKTLKGPEIIRRLLMGEDVACVSDAGLPGIADPGSQLVRLAIDAGIVVVPLPGANAALSALICSGLDTTAFTFIGFLPKSFAKATATLERIKDYPETLIFYIAPHHLAEDMARLIAVLGELRPAAAARELTKRFEEFRRGTLRELKTYFAQNEPRGEFVLVVAGKALAKEAATPAQAAAHALELMSGGLDKKAAMKKASQELNVSRNEIYAALLAAQSATDCTHQGVEAK